MIRRSARSLVLRLENFDVENAPDLYVYAVAAGDANDAGTVLDSGFFDLGRLEGNRAIGAMPYRPASNRKYTG